MKTKLLLLSFLFTLSSYAQERQLIKGRVVAGGIPVSQRGVVNLNSRTDTKSDTLGNFKIMAMVTDTIVVQTSSYYTRRVVVREKDLKQMLVVDLGSFELEEVVIDKYGDINAESLGLVPKGQKQYTRAEKKLFTAGEIKSVWDVVAMVLGMASLDAIINAITGRTKVLKKELEYETKSTAMTQIYSLYTEEDINTKLSVPKEYVGGFVYYAVENSDVLMAISENNDEKAKFLLRNLAFKYLEILKGNEEE
ncbi:hypothetical protein V1389_16155 [Flavobacterium rakeshii]|uniref:hypothetical protein n=1 Tax=Flavobacterium rakeshii TaxID=1038845 RepID=UPI002E7C3408|nr:hypothetical protein [Flavobacterium rakeshii]MEE1899882.1 hypothetical protein [Flavobacterium rakeshii]